MPVTLHRVGHRFGGQPWLFRNFDLTLVPGSVYALSGPSGSGKSTLLSILAGWTKPAEGLIDTHDIAAVSWVFQNPHGSPRRSALDHVTLPLLARGTPLREAQRDARELMAEFRIDHLADRPFRDLSGGEAQRLMLARGRASRPDLLLIDEPTAQLDPATAETVNDAIIALRTPELIAVVATHHPGTREACTHQIDLANYRGGEP